MIIIEPAVSTDSFVIEKLDSMVWDESASDMVMSDSNYTWRIWIDNALVYAVKKDQGIVGVALAFPAKNGSYCLHKILVDPQWREQHLASNLLDTMLHETDKLQVPTFVTLFADNVKALSLYKNHGFFQDAERTAANRQTNTVRLSRTASDKPHFSANNYLSSIYRE